MHIDLDEFEKGYLAFQSNESRDAMYKVATFLINEFWGKPREIADALGVLLLTWNNAFYRYGPFDFYALEECIKKNQEILGKYRGRSIMTYESTFDAEVHILYEDFLSTLQISSGKSIGKRSPVSVSKALHLIAPEFFPLWDDKISRAYHCRYSYLKFMKVMHRLAFDLSAEFKINKTGKTLLKLMDEYNYAKFTKGWV